MRNLLIEGQDKSRSGRFQPVGLFLSWPRLCLSLSLFRRRGHDTMSPTNGIACLSLGLLVGLRFLSSLIGCILIGRRFSFSCAGRLRHNQSHLWTHRSFSLPGCRAVVILVVPLFCSVFSWPSRPSNRNKGMTTIDHYVQGALCLCISRRFLLSFLCGWCKDRYTSAMSWLTADRRKGVAAVNQRTKRNKDTNRLSPTPNTIVW